MYRGMEDQSIAFRTFSQNFKMAYAVSGCSTLQFSPKKYFLRTTPDCLGINLPCL